MPPPDVYLVVYNDETGESRVIASRRVDLSYEPQNPATHLDRISYGVHASLTSVSIYPSDLGLRCRVISEGRVLLEGWVARFGTTYPDGSQEVFIDEDRRRPSTEVMTTASGRTGLVHADRFVPIDPAHLTTERTTAERLMAMRPIERMGHLDSTDIMAGVRAAYPSTITREPTLPNNSMPAVQQASLAVAYRDVPHADVEYEFRFDPDGGAEPLVRRTAWQRVLEDEPTK